MKPIYLDNNATTPIWPEVLEAMLPFLSHQACYGNPSSLHWAGREVNAAVERARQQVADLIHATADEVVFTACGTEGDNFALLGTMEALASKGNHLITTAVEHPAVLDTCRYFEQRGGRVTYLPVNGQGLIDLGELEAAITPQTVLISVMWANNETGTLFPIKEIGAIARRYGVRFHCDAVQALGKVPIDVERARVDLLVLSGHKIGAPKGVGALYIRRGTDMVPYLHGGHQERGLRAGTHNVPGIVGFGAACSLIGPRLEQEMQRLQRLRDRLEQGIRLGVAEVGLNGHPQQRLANTLNLSFPFVEGEGLLLALDMLGIAASSGSACTSGSEGASHVLRAMGASDMALNSSVRFSLGYQTTEEEIDYVLEQLPPLVERLRQMSPFSSPQDEDLSVFNCPVVECTIDDH
ncbi:MAG: cysteine desulfurase NifS [Desulfuromonadaceae bacterium]|nr:cysteine desulfurase NifS [Desulfuromonadaceae bacterium]